MHPDRDFNLQQVMPTNAPALMQDLELNTLLRVMSGDDEFLFDVARAALLSGLQNDLDTIAHRQAVLKDCLNNQAVIRELYDLSVRVLEERRKHWFGVFSTYPSSILSGAIEMLQMLTGMLGNLRSLAREHAGRFESKGFVALFAMLEKELNDEYFARIQTHLTDLKFREGVLISAELGRGNEGAHYVLRKPRDGKRSRLARLLGQSPPGYTFRIADRDEAGFRALSELRDRGIHLVANALAQSGDHILGFFQMLRAELAFYVGCLNLHGRLASKVEPICFPRPVAAGERRHRFHGLYDACLSLHMERRTAGNSIDADRRSLIIITGANRGGKSSFLRRDRKSVV